ncbi:MAG: NUDIX hydrolase [Candidatus Niyogibacteria bacterium]|nr:NUDIX hydrolase [Candidatus Niyogibacteria bacterium]
METNMPKKCPAGSVGIIFERDGKYLVLRRLGTPLGWAGVAGHLDGDTPLVAAQKEAREEVGVELGLVEPVFGPELIMPNPCGRDGGIYNAHDWHVYRALKWEGEPRNCEPENHADLRWATPEELQYLFWNEPHDPAWFYIFRELEII